ncbi:DUF1934 family protein [Virgibacillus dakarensis]|uniref:DUF1934 domain-containing protein n=1 Tax=Lentibacillus populi TaxID=1827502 RepID=A0A9W5TVZ6_9BACI|nr:MULTISPECIES: DUF1934 domain-containing protein [Bacillaceae]MBT2215272.1 DUF1934 family protein [Virgibacillus dakarensis]MTW86089.1 DUF1934 family protein [Virgibacillus dakarensis]GGB34957.1 hypothetical protein GCM10011409_10520 [Lentibacillus populi]
MEIEQTRVAVEFCMTIEDNGQLEETKAEATGVLYKKGQMDVLTYNEHTEDNDIIKNLLTIQPEKVSIKRTGPVQMHQQLRLKQPSENLFHHAHGTIHMETFTDRINYQPLSTTSQGKLAIDYHVRLNGQQIARKHQLTLTLKEEE